jgi:hypothetical protein
MREVLLAIALTVTGCAPAAGPSEPAPLNCLSGPVERTFGGTRWLVYGCDDRESLAIKAVSDNPAAPLVFILSKIDGRYEVDGDRIGEGRGDLEAALAADKDIRRLDAAAVEALLRETAAVGR